MTERDLSRAGPEERSADSPCHDPDTQAPTVANQGNLARDDIKAIHDILTAIHMGLQLLQTANESEDVKREKLFQIVYECVDRGFAVLRKTLSATREERST